MTDQSPIDTIRAGAAVYRRTFAGQREVLAESLPLSTVERSLLRRLTGYTPVHVLVHPQEAQTTTHVQQAVSGLISQGLIEPARQRANVDRV